ncbi:MAG: O-antigen ligase family protein [Oscillospiraceae bacterium]|nr:O-antigen ligase family protein [Oscillospiraceae bacterium]
MGISQTLRQRFDKFLYSPAYFVVLGSLSVLANVLGRELIAYSILIPLAICVCLFGRDLLPLMPVFACAYISPSAANNPGVNEKSIFSLSGGGIYLGILLAVLVGSLIYRLVKDPDFGGKKFLNQKRKLLSGMCVLGITYAISGLCSGHWAEYGWRNLLFAAIQFVAVAGLYWLFSGSVKWEQAPKAYVYWMGICVGYVLVAELLSIYLTKQIWVGGTIHREHIFTGWGNYNSMGALFAMMIPLPFYLAVKGRFTWFGLLSSFVFLAALLFTCSRVSMIMGAVIFVISYVFYLIHSRHAKGRIVIYAISALIPIVVLTVFWKEIQSLLGRMSDIGFESIAERSKGYAEGIKQFLKYPIFGGTFFPVNFKELYVWAQVDNFTALFPPRWHNTVIQLLATGGVVCLFGYIVHRVQTVKLFLKNPSGDKTFVALSILALLLASLLDCHFFNVGPVLLYSAMLAFTEFKLDK